MSFYERPGYPRPPPPYEPPSPRRRPIPWVSYGIIGISALMFLVVDRLFNSNPNGIPPGVLYGPYVRRGDWWRVITYAFEHGGLLHIVLNMSVVWTLGIVLEENIGHLRFLVVSLVTCLGSAAAAMYFAYNAPVVGASGMILGWAGVMFPIATRQGRKSLGIWLAQVAAISLIPGVSWQAHLGGFLSGIPCGLALRGGPVRFRQWAPFLIFAAALVALAAAHPERFGPH